MDVRESKTEFLSGRSRDYLDQAPVTPAQVVTGAQPMRVSSVSVLRLPRSHSLEKQKWELIRRHSGTGRWFHSAETTLPCPNWCMRFRQIAWYWGQMNADHRCKGFLRSSPCKRSQAKHTRVRRYNPQAPGGEVHFQELTEQLLHCPATALRQRRRRFPQTSRGQARGPKQRSTCVAYVLQSGSPKRLARAIYECRTIYRIF